MPTYYSYTRFIDYSTQSNSAATNTWSNNNSIVPSAPILRETTPMPNYAVESKLGTVTFDRVIIELSDIRRVLVALKNKKNTGFSVRVKPKEPIHPFKALHGSILNRYRIKDEKELLESKEPTEKLKWEYLDTWQNRWVSFNLSVDTLGSQQSLDVLMNTWNTYREAKRKYLENKDKYETIETTVVDYINKAYQTITNGISVANMKTETEWSLYGNWTKLLKENFQGTKTSTGTIRDTMVHDPAFRYEKTRDIRRKLPRELRFKTCLQLGDILQFIKKLYEIRYKGESLLGPLGEWGAQANPIIFYCHHAKQIDWGLDGVFRTQGGHYVPKRYLDTFLYHTCLLCDVPFQCDGGYVIIQKSPDIARYFGQLLHKIKNPSETKVESNDVKQSIKQILERKQSGKKGPPSDVLIVPNFGEMLNRWYDLKTLNKSNYEPRPVCFGCYETHIRRRDNGAPRNLIRNYSDNPINHFKDSSKITPEGLRLHSFAKGEHPSIKILKGRKIDTTLYLGVELEVTPSKYLLDLLTKSGVEQGNLPGEAQYFGATLINEFLSKNKTGIMKADSTVVGGFEIVTIPGTHGWHTKEAWKGFFKEDWEKDEEKLLAPSTFLCGWANNGGKRKKYQELYGPNYPICGIHVHASMAFFSPLGLSKVVRFINGPEYQKFVWHIAGRTPSNTNSVRTKNIKTGAKVLQQLRYNGHTDIEGERERHQALNTNTGKNTIEFRIFRSNVSKAGFMKNIDFVQALIMWCELESLSNMSIERFCKYVEENKGQYKWLYLWLCKHKYLSNVHTFNPKFTKEYEFGDDTQEFSEELVA